MRVGTTGILVGKQKEVEMLALRKKKGFTLLELVIVMVIIGILVSLALPRFTGARRRAYRVEALAVINEVKSLAWAHNLEQGGTGAVPVWPTGTEAEIWSALGYTVEPTTGNWTFTVAVEDLAIDTFVITATAVGGSPADGSPNVVLTLEADGSSSL